MFREVSIDVEQCEQEGRTDSRITSKISPFSGLLEAAVAIFVCGDQSPDGAHSALCKRKITAM